MKYGARTIRQNNVDVPDPIVRHLGDGRMAVTFILDSQKNGIIMANMFYGFSPLGGVVNFDYCNPRKPMIVYNAKMTLQTPEAGAF